MFSAPTLLKTEPEYACFMPLDYRTLIVIHMDEQNITILNQIRMYPIKRKYKSKIRVIERMSGAAGHPSLTPPLKTVQCGDLILFEQ